MSKFDDNMEEIFDIDLTAIEAKGGIIKQIDSEMSVDATKDYEYTRANLYNLIDKASEAINDVLDLARESNHPRAYEVAGNFIKQTADMTDKLIDLQKKIKDLDKVDKKTAAINGNVTNNMFFGTTADLQLLLKKGKVEEE